MKAAPDGEAAAPLAILNHPPKRLPGPVYLHELVRRSAIAGNAAIEYLPVEGDPLSISYDELGRRSDSLAQKLTALRREQLQRHPNDDQFVVPILAPQHPNLYVALLAILKAGGAFCPLNLDAPAERVKFILKDVAATLVLTTAKYASSIPHDASVSVLVLDHDETTQVLPTAGLTPRSAEPTDLAYVMYTSGSTGTPKGVGVSHEAAAQSLLAHDRHIPRFSRFLQFAAPTFDVSVFEIFFPLLRGCTLISCDRVRMLDDLPGVIRAMDIDACELTPSVAGSLLRKRENAPCLRLLLTIGEMLTKPVVDEFGGGDGRPSMLWAMYGPTEAAIHCTLQPELAREASVGNIGFPLDTVSAFILKIPEETDTDKIPRVLRVGEVGELAVGGHQLASGYINRPETTSLAFIDSPYGLLYRTLDKARVLPDGRIECLGRIGGGQVKLRGQRIELGEIEQVALRTPVCHGALAAVIGGILVLFCAVDGLDCTVDDIRSTCEAWLPKFMVPGDIVAFAAFPRLPSGKVDRRKLISDYSTRQEKNAGCTAEFKDSTERRLCHLAGSILDRDIQPSENLSAAGMDSLKAIKLTSALRQAGLELSALDVLESRSISQLHQIITERPENDTSSTQPARIVTAGTNLSSGQLRLIPILQHRQENVEEVLPCTPLQSAMLAVTASDPQAYCNWLELTVLGQHDATTIRSWIFEMAKRNTILRTGFVLHKGAFIQVIWKEPPPNMISAQDHLVRDFSLTSDEDFFHPFRVHVCVQENESRILLQIHHSLYDGWTLDLLLKDLNALSNGNELKPRPQFSDVVQYTQTEGFAAECDIARSFWADSLSGFQPKPIPVLRDAPPERNAVASRVTTFDLGPQSVTGILREIECSPQVVFQAALAWLWSSLVGDEDITTGFVTSGRTTPVPGIEHIMGPCIASLPLRTNLAQTRTIKDLLGNIQAQIRSSLPHASLPLSEIKKAAGIVPGHSLYDVLFVYQESLYSRRRDDDCIREAAHLDYLETKLLVEVEPTTDSYECRLTYHTDSFSDAHIDAFTDELLFVARHMLENVDSDLKSTRAGFPDRLLSAYNLEPQSFTRVPDLAWAVEQVVAKTPDKTALCFARGIGEARLDAEYVSYRELNSLATRIARHLRLSGCSTGDVVSIVMEKSVLLYAGILGIVKAGCSYLPLLPTTPAARMELIHAQAEVKLCLADNVGSAKLLQLEGVEVVNLEQTELKDIDDTNLDIPADPPRVAVIVYTSGSTGVPKGVCVTQLNVTSNIDVLSRIYPVGDGSRLLQSCSQAFDVSVFEIFFTWTQGMTLCSATNDTLFEDLERAIRAFGITHLSMTPTVASLVDPRKVPSVEFLVTSGEPMTETVARSWWRQLYQGYGPSETTNICTVKKMGPNDAIRHLGHSFSNTSTVVLYQEGTEAVPRGCLGELCFGGDQVAQGYLNAPQLTAAKFIHHPKFGRLYRSGDIGRMLPDGSLVITGRADDQIKLRGQRIELHEINSTIRESVTVSECFTMLVNRENPSSTQLASFYVPRDSAGDPHSGVVPLDDRIKEMISTLYRLLASKLPSYMVPSYLIPIAKVPVTASGKVDRAWFVSIFDGLEQSYLASTVSTNEGEHDDGEWTETEQQVSNIVCSVLSTRGSSMNRWTPLVSFGLDSISAITLSRQFQQKLNRRIPISLILQNPCVARLAHILDGREHEETRDAVSHDIFPRDWLESVKARCQSRGNVVEKVLPCTPLQEAMLAASASGRSYLNNMLFRLHTDPAAMQSYWATLCKRHIIFRTCFATTDVPNHAFAQVVLQEWQPMWLHLDESDGTIDGCISRRLASHLHAVDSGEPPLSFAIIRQRQDVYMSFVCHHALYDGIAIELLLHEVEQLANGIPLDSPPPVEPFLRAMLAGSSTPDDFWKRQLLGFRPVELPTSNSPLVGGKTHDIHSTTIDMSLSDISERTKNLGCSLLSLCQAAWTLVLATVLGAEDVCFGNVVSCRSVDVEGVENLVAPCFNTVPVRANLANVRQIIDLIKTLNALNPQIIEHQFASLRHLQSLVHPGEIRRLFDTLLILQQPARKLDHGLWSLERDDGEMDIPLVCEFRPDPQEDVLSVQLHYECSRISRSFVDVIAELLQYSISVCLNYPSSQIPTSTTIPARISKKLSKLDLQRKSPAAPKASSEQSVQNGESWSDPESRIRAVLSKLSSVPEQNIRRTTAIYQLGLDSINAVQVASLLRKQGLRISASEVIEQKTCANLAKMATQVNADTNPSSPPSLDFPEYQSRAESQLSEHGIPKHTVGAILPCTPLQAGMIVQFIQSQGHNYFNFVDYELDADIDLRVLSNAWMELARSHAILRTGFVPVDDAVSPFAMVQYHKCDVQAPVSLIETKSEPRWTVEAWRQEMASEVLENIRLPPWRVACVRHDDGSTMHLAFHHALYDAQSLQMMMGDLASIVRGEPLPLSPATEDAVRDIIIQGFQTHKHEAFWQTRSEQLVINHFPKLTPLRLDHRTTVVESLVSSNKFTAVEKAIATSGFTVQAALQAAWTRILSAYLGESSVTFGVVLSGRNSEATQDAVFPCISTIPVISSNKASNRELLQSMLEYSGRMYQSQHVPLNKIQRWLGYPDGKLFDTLLVYQKLSQPAHISFPWQVINDQGTVNYPLSIEVEPSTYDALVYRITAFGNIVPTEHARLLLQQFDAVFSDLALRPGGHEDDLFSPAPELFAVTPAEEPVVYCEEEFLHQFIELQVLKTPDKTALEFVTGFRGARPLSKTWSYRALDEYGNSVARLLQPHVRTGDTVAVLFDKCPEAFFSILGVLKAGCAFVALDPGAPAARKKFILEDSRAAVLLISRDLEDSLDFSINIPCIVVDEISLSNLDGNPVTPSPSLTPQHTCYCLYTSGTTGTPKGCEITHENAVQAMLAFQRLFAGHWDETSKWLQFASFHFDVSVLEQYWTWSVGMTLTAAPRDLILEDLAGTISQLEITHIDLTPSLARLIHPDEVPSLTRGVFITGGEQLKQEILDAWGSKGVIYNAYGPTEATIGVTTYSRVPQNGRPSNIGKQFVNVGTYVLKPGTETPVLRGGVGELCVAGKLVGKGYLGRDDLTAERFPVLKRFDERVYRTGDLVRILHDGCFDFLGRADDQVKLRGQRLELGEINHTIRSGVKDVADVATLVVRNEKQRKDVLVTFVGTGKHSSQAQDLLVLEGPAASDLAQRVQTACRDRLPGYMVPTYVLVLPFIPLSSNNKAEFRTLKKLFVDLKQSKLMALSKPIATTPELNEVERTVFRALTTVATTPPPEVVSSSATIFDFGIDSISVMRLCTALKRAGFDQASPSLVLTHPSLGDLTSQLSRKRTSSGKNHTLAAKQLVQACHHKYLALAEKELRVVGTDIQYIAPCSPLQEGMISRSNMPFSKGAYFNTFKYRLSSHVSSSQLRVAWSKLVDSCSVLRTRFLSTPEGYIQVATKVTNIPWTELCLATESDLEDLVKEKQQLWIESNVHHVKQPLEVMIVSIGKETRYMVLNISHGIYDAISLDIMLDQLRQYYLDAPVSASAPSYLEALVHGPLRSYSESKDFWIAHLKSASCQPFPVICAQPSNQSVSCDRLVSVSSLENLRATLGVTHQSIIQAAWVSVYQHLLADTTFGVVISGRSIDLEGAANVIGPLFNTVAFHAAIAPGETWASLIKQCHEFNVSIIPFQHVALRDLQKWCSGGRPLFDTLFSFQRATDGPTPGDELWSLSESPPNPDYALAFEATLTSDSELRLQLVAKAGIADMDILSGLLEEVEVALRLLHTPELVIPTESHHSPEARPNGMGHDEQAFQNLDAFEWTAAALAIRDEIATLADVPAESVTATTSLLELGLDSIDCIKLSSRLRGRGIMISSGQLMKEGTISAMVRYLQREAPDIENTVNTTPSIHSGSAALKSHLHGVGYDLDGVADVLPVTPLQDAMVAEMVQSDFQRYFNHDVLEIDQGIDTDRLLRAWKQVVDESPILRTVFEQIESPDFGTAYCQVVFKTMPLVVEEVSLTDENELSRVMESARKRASAAGARSDLLQLGLAKTDKRRFLVLSIAHALYDGWSLGLLHQDVQAAYHGSYVPRPSYEDCLGRIITASTLEARQFWSGYLAGAHATLVPRNIRLSMSKTEEVHRIDTLSSVPAPQIQGFCKRHAISLQVLAQACWTAVLASQTRSLDVTFGVVLSGRDTEEAESLLFPTMNTVAVRSVLHGGVASWLRYMQENMASINSFQHYPLRDALKLAGQPRGGLFNSLFIHQRAEQRRRDESTPWMRSIGGDSAVEYPFCVEVEMSDEQLVWRAACSAEYLSRKETLKLVHDVDAVLGYIVRLPSADVLAFEGEQISVCGLASFELLDIASDGTADAKMETGLEISSAWSETESQIRSVISEVAAVPTASVMKQHTVYHLGLDSISAIKVSPLLRKRGVVLGVRQILGAQSITEMAAVASRESAVGGVEANSASTNGTARTPDGLDDGAESITTRLQSINVATLLEKAGLTEVEVGEVLPATAMQVHMLSVWQNTAGAVFFPESTYLLQGCTDIDTIRSAWVTLLEHHPILRTVFLATGSQQFPFVQVVQRRRSEVAGSMIHEDTWTSSNKSPSLDSLVSLRVSRVDDDRWRLELKIHHALYDGVSLPIMMDTFRQLCKGATLPPENRVHIWKEWLSSQVIKTNRLSRQTFWSHYLADASPSPFPRRTTSPQSRTPSRTSFFNPSAIDDTTTLQSLCSTSGVSLQALFLAAYARFLASSIGQDDDVVFGIYLANRTSLDGMDLLPYPTLSLVPLRVRRSAAVSETDLLSVARGVQADLYEISSPANASVGLWEILEWTGVRVDSFINFLTLPSVEAEGTEEVSLMQVAGGIEEEEQTSAGLPPDAQRWMASNAVRDAYPDAVDIEVSLTEGAMNIGVFGPLSMVDEAGAKEVAAGIVDILATALNV